jgi:hypothetical protein
MMWFWRKWLHGKGMSRPLGGKRRRKARRQPVRLALEMLEERTVLDSGGTAGVLSGAGLVYSSNKGPLISSVSVQILFLKDSSSGNEISSTNRSQFDTFFSTITSDGYISKQLNQYSTNGYTIGDGTVGTDDIDVSVTTDTTASGYNSISDSLIQKTVAKEISAKHTASATANTLYFVFTPPGDAVGDDTTGNSVNDFLGYHSAFSDSKSPSGYD